MLPLMKTGVGKLQIKAQTQTTCLVKIFYIHTDMCQNKGEEEQGI